MHATKLNQVVRVTVLSMPIFLMLFGTGAHGGSAILAAQRSPGMNSGRPIDPPPTGVPPLAETPPPGVLDPGVSTQAEQERARQMAEGRRKRAVADVDKLVALSNELKTDMDKSTKDQLSLDVIKKAKEIEKLAHDLQGRVKE